MYLYLHASFMDSKITHHLNIRGDSGKEVKKLVVVDHVWITKFLGELIHTCRKNNCLRTSRDQGKIYKGFLVTIKSSCFDKVPCKNAHLHYELRWLQPGILKNAITNIVFILLLCWQ